MAWQNNSSEAKAKGSKKVLFTSATNRNDDGMTVKWLGNVKSECAEDEGTDWEDGESTHNDDQICAFSLGTGT